MLKYSFNVGDIIKDIKEIKLVSVSVDDYGFDDHFVATITHDGSSSFTSGSDVAIKHRYYVDTATKKNGIIVESVVEYKIQTANNSTNIISLNIPKKTQLNIESVDFPLFSENKNTINIKFKQNHCFQYGTPCNITVGGNDIVCEFVDEKTLKFVYDIDREEDTNVMNLFFPDESYYVSGASENVVEYTIMQNLPYPVLFTSPTYVMLEQDVDNEQFRTIYRKTIGVASVSDILVLRDNFLFGEDDGVTIIPDQNSFEINVALQQGFETKLQRDWILEEKSTKDQADAMVVPPTSIEKDVYYPSLVDCHGGIHFAKRIKFNLHFRKRDLSEGWSTPDEDAFWNGTNDANPSTPFLSNAAYNDQNTNTLSQYTSNRSDLLSKIGFTDSDVKYQKSRLKKSFLRLSYFDSTNPATQLLVGYSTVFFDTGKLLSKYIKHSHDTEYYKPLPDNSQSYVAYSGRPISVSNEPFYIPSNYEVFEEMRLSTQFVISDRFSSTSSSEGFYIYLYKDYSSELPQDLYMRVEFNHAGYGKKVPFYLPHQIPSVNQTFGIKSYADILSDWSDPNTSYGFDLYNVYSYIHLKYKYDFENKKHVYYIDPEYYGHEVMYNPNADNDIIINLYEAKVTL